MTSRNHSLFYSLSLYGSKQKRNTTIAYIDTLTNYNYMENTQQETSSNRTVRASSIQPNNWIFPPKTPSPLNYNNETFLPGDCNNGFKGFRKTFSGRFKRLVSKKSEPTSTIPPELKSQLKSIYVY